MSEMDLKEIGKWIKKNEESLNETGKPICVHCGKHMINWTPTSGPFKGKLQKHDWVCDCPDYPKNCILSMG